MRLVARQHADDDGRQLAGVDLVPLEDERRVIEILAPNPAAPRSRPTRPGRAGSSATRLATQDSLRATSRGDGSGFVPGLPASVDGPIPRLGCVDRGTMAREVLAGRSREEGAPREVQRAGASLNLTEQVVGERDGCLHGQEYDRSYLAEQDRRPTDPPIPIPIPTPIPTPDCPRALSVQVDAPGSSATLVPSADASTSMAYIRLRPRVHGAERLGPGVARALPAVPAPARAPLPLTSGRTRSASQSTGKVTRAGH